MINHLDRTFGAHIDLSNVTHPDPGERARTFRSRALTALAVQMLAGVDPEEAATCVIDGFDDHGLDGIAVSADRRHVWFVQTKWSDQGKASLNEGEAFKLVNGIQMLQDNEYDEFNERIELVRDALDDALQTPGVQIAVVVCLLGKQPLSPAPRAVLEKYVDACNSPYPVAELVEIHFDDVYDVVKRGAADKPVNLMATLEHWGQLTHPYQAYYGCVSGSEVADWFAAAGDALFGKNIRSSLGRTEVNEGIRTTIRENPDSFWYFNNGITILCDGVRKTLKGSKPALGSFELSGASVVNGAQTVRSIHDEARDHPDAADAARVWVRIISLEDCPDGFAGNVTDATNTQNQVIARDFVAIDHVQNELRTEFALALGKVYVVKRGEPAPDPDDGCTVEELARVLACAQPDAAFAARAAKRDVLWERGESGTYSVLFGRPPGAERAWALVSFLRAVGGRLRQEENKRDGRAQLVATLAEPLVVHVLLQLRGDSLHSHPAAEEVPQLLDHVGPMVDFLVLTIDGLYGGHSLIPSTLSDADRCVELAAAALDHLASGRSTPELPLQYQAAARRSQRTRKPNVVTVLVDEGAVADGTPLRFVASAPKEEAAFAPWLAEDPRRGRATWVNNRGKPLLWEADGLRYSPTGLVMAMARSVGRNVKAVQGPRYWAFEDGRSLVDRARAVREEAASG